MSEQDEKPDPEQFARIVLWHLCGLQASVAQLHAKVNLLRGTSPTVDELKSDGQQIYSIRKCLYEEMLKQSKIQPSSEFPPVDLA